MKKFYWQNENIPIQSPLNELSNVNKIFDNNKDKISF